MRTPPSRGLPPRIYVPILAVFAVAFLALMAYLLSIGLGNTGTALGPGVSPPGAPSQSGQAGLPGTSVGGGGPPAPVMAELEALRGRLKTNPKDVSALDELGDLYHEVGKDDQAAGFYRRALRADPHDAHSRDALAALGDAR